MEPDSEYEHPKYSLIEKFNKLYDSRPPFQDFINFQFASIPTSLPDATNKIKHNFSKFAFYYIVFYLVFDTIHFFINRLLLIPIITFAVGYYLLNNEFIISGQKVQKYHVILGCIVLNILFIIFSSAYLFCIFSFFALNGFISMINILHAIFINQQLEGQESEI